MDKKRPGPGGMTEAEVAVKKAAIAKMRGYGMTIKECTEAMNIARQTYDNWRKVDEEFRQKTQIKGDTFKRLVDKTIQKGIITEGIIMDRYLKKIENSGEGGILMKQPDTPKTEFYAKTRGGMEGAYSEKKHVTFDGGIEITKTKRKRLDEIIKANYGNDD